MKKYLCYTWILYCADTRNWNCTFMFLIEPFKNSQVARCYINLTTEEVGQLMGGN